jgi:hypothetical protein
MKQLNIKEGKLSLWMRLKLSVRLVYSFMKITKSVYLKEDDTFKIGYVLRVTK